MFTINKKALEDLMNYANSDDGWEKITIDLIHTRERTSNKRTEMYDVCLLCENGGRQNVVYTAMGRSSFSDAVDILKARVDFPDDVEEDGFDL